MLAFLTGLPWDPSVPRADWEFVDHIGEAKMGYGYSDVHVLKDGSVAIAFQRTFNPPVSGIEGGGYDVGLAIVTHDPRQSK